MPVFNIVPALGEVKLPGPDPLALLLQASKGGSPGRTSSGGAGAGVKSPDYPYLPSQSQQAYQFKQQLDARKRVDTFNLMSDIQNMQGNAFEYLSSPEGLNRIYKIQNDYVTGLNTLSAFDTLHKANVNVYTGVMSQVESGKLKDIDVMYDAEGKPIMNLETWKDIATSDLVLGDKLTPFHKPDFDAFNAFVNTVFQGIDMTGFQKTLSSVPLKPFQIAGGGIYDVLQTRTFHTMTGNKEAYDKTRLALWEGIKANPEYRQIFNIYSRQAYDWFKQTKLGQKKTKEEGGGVYTDDDFKNTFADNFLDIMTGKFYNPEESWSTTTTEYDELDENQRLALSYATNPDLLEPVRTTSAFVYKDIVETRVMKESSLAASLPHGGSYGPALKKLFSGFQPTGTVTTTDSTNANSKIVQETRQRAGIADLKEWNGEGTDIQDANHFIDEFIRKYNKGVEVNTPIWFGEEGIFYDETSLEGDPRKAALGAPSITIRNLTGKIRESLDPRKYISRGEALIKAYKNITGDEELVNNPGLRILSERLDDVLRDNFLYTEDFALMEYIVEEGKLYGLRTGPADFKTLTTQVIVEASSKDRGWFRNKNSDIDVSMDDIYVHSGREVTADEDMYVKGQVYEKGGKLKMKGETLIRAYERGKQDFISYGNVWVPVDYLNIGAFGSLARFKIFASALQDKVNKESDDWTQGTRNAFLAGMAGAAD